jgi:hypothetical protein
MTTPDHTTPAPDLVVADVLDLRAFAPGGLHQGHPATTDQGLDVVVLNYCTDDADQLDVHSRNGARRLRARTPATALTDPEIRADLTRGALLHLAEQLSESRIDLACATAGHARVLAEIRRYAIDRHLDDDYCRSGLNAFLAAFGMPEYQPRIRVSYLIRGSYEIDNQDTYRAERDATGYLKPDLTGLDAVMDHTDTHTVEVTAILTLDD